MPNWFAYIALVTWPFVAIWLFATRPLTQAILWTVLGAQLILPVGTTIKIAMIPQFDKNSIPSICLLIGCLFASRSPWRFGKPGIAAILVAAYVVGPLFTAQLNGDAILFGDRVLPGVDWYDGTSAVIAAIISLIPFLVGRQFFRENDDIEAIFLALVCAALVYSMPLLFEIRMSPQLHYLFYGYSPSQFAQSVRGDGYRPMVFMGHGLIAAMFLVSAVIAAATLWRAKITIFKLPAGPLTAYLGGILILCKSLGAAVYGAFLIPAVRLLKPRTQGRIAVVLVSISLLYPSLRFFDLFPTRYLVESASVISEDRGGSLKYRFDNEDILLARALERPFFGWGRYGRNRVYEENSGNDNSVTDGLWIIALGTSGILGFIAQFGVLTLGVFRAAPVLKSSRDGILLSALSLIVSVNILDLLPNSGLLPWTWLLCGALLGRAERLSESTQKSTSALQPRAIRRLGA
jgi:hypothetical protein